jgi:type II secretory pathway component GspD/PulD (secretin)
MAAKSRKVPPMSKLIPGLSLLVLMYGCECSKPTAAQPQTTQSERFQVVPLKYANANEIAGELGKAQREAQLVADARTNSLIVTARSDEALATVLELIARLDVETKPAH